MEKLWRKAREYIFSHARKLEQSRWRYHFEAGSKEEVIHALSAYQNSDGGFGHGLEPDFFTKESSPIATWTACMILDSLDLQKDHPMILKTLTYFKNCAYQKNGLYYYTIPSVNDFPHAPWWIYTKEREIAGYNPTASIIGFVLKYANKESDLFLDFMKRLENAVKYLKTTEVHEKHELRNFVELYHFIEALPQAREVYPYLKKAIKKGIDLDIDKWFSTYTTKPLDIIVSTQTPGYDFAKDLIQVELQNTIQRQTADGSWDIAWSWGDNSAAEKKSRKHWKGIVTLDMILKIQMFF